MGIEKIRRPVFGVTGEIVAKNQDDIIKERYGGSGVIAVTLSQAEYNALPVKDDNVLYIIPDE